MSIFNTTIQRFATWRRNSAARGLRAGGGIETDDEERYRPLQWPLIKRLLQALAPFKKWYIIAISLGLCHVTLDMMGPKFMKRIIDTGVAYSLAGTSAAIQKHGLNVIGIIIGLWALTIIASVILQRYTILYMTAAGESVQFEFRRKLFAQLQRLSMSYYDKTKLGRIISRCTSDINSLREVNVWGIWQVIANVMIMVVAGAFMIQESPKLFLSIVWLGPVVYILTRMYHKKAGSMWQVVREGFTRVSTNLAENITGMRVVTAFNRQDPNLTVFNRLQDANTENNVAAARINGIFQPLLEVVRFCGRVTIVVYGGYMIATLPGGEKKVGSVVAFWQYWDWFMGPLITLGAFYNTLLQAMAGAERVTALLDMQPDVMDVPEAKPLPRIVGRVQFENVTFGYNPDRPILHEINFDAESGQMIALVGATGSGKSSIISLIARFYQPQKGRVLVDGHDIRYVTGDSLHKQMGLVLQSNYLFSGTVLENIRYTKPDATDAQVIQAAQSIGSYDAIMSLADGFKSDVGERGANMSLGQRQLICFTRAFLADPRIFMLDEATSAVDTSTELLVQRSLEKLLAGRTTFVVAHRLSTIMRADMILVIDAGRIIERGTHRQLLAAAGKYAHLYEQFVQQSE